MKRFQIKAIRYGQNAKETKTIEATEFVIEDNLIIFRRYSLTTHNEVLDLTYWNRVEVTQLN